MSSKTSIIITIIGFFLFFFGMMALVLSMLDLRIPFMDWIPNTFGRLIALLVNLSMIIMGLVAVVAARGNFAGEDPVPVVKEQ
ncbi:MAG: hypothetical protein ACI94Y_002961 [Maribacter sp.]|jgi:hypothetical protein